MSASTEKTLSELLDLPVVFVDSGREFGRIDSFLVDNDKGIILGYVLSGNNSTGIRMVPPSAVSRYGTFAITVTGENVVEDIKTDSVLSRIYNNEPQFLGLSVQEFGEDGEELGYIKDVSFKTPGGQLGSVWISNERGFTSPYVAKIDYRDISGVFKDKAILKENCKLNFRRTGVLEHAAEKGGFVPLVIRDQEWRSALNDRLAEETAKIHRRLITRLEADHQKFFLANEKERLKNELLETLKNTIDSVFDNRFSVSSEKLRDEINYVSSTFVSIEDFKTGTGDLNERVEQLSIKIEKGLEEMTLAETKAEERFNKKIESLTSTLENRAAASFDSAFNRLSDAAERKIDSVRKESATRISEVEERFETKLMTVNASVQTFERSTSAIIEKLKETIKVVAGDASVYALEKTEELTSSIGELRKRVAELADAPPPVIPDVSNLSSREELNKLDSKMSSLIHESLDALKERINNVVASSAESAEILVALKPEMEQNIKKYSDLISTAMESRLAGVQEELDSSSTRIFDKIESKISSFVTAEMVEQKLAEFTPVETEKGVSAQEFENRLEEMAKKIETINLPASMVDKIHQIENKFQEVVSKVDFDSVINKLNELKTPAPSSGTGASHQILEEIDKKVKDLVSFEQLKIALHTALGGASITDVRSELLVRINELKSSMSETSSGSSTINPEIMEKFSAEIASLAERALEHADEHIKELSENLDAAISSLYPKDEIEELISRAIAEAEKRIIESLKKDNGSAAG